MKIRPLIAFGLVALASPFLVHCADLSKVAASTCGNAVVDPGEDCDTFSPANNCGRPDEGASACHLKCAGVACPDGWGCSVTGICRAPTGELGLAGPPLETGVSTLAVGDFDHDGRVDVVGSGEPGADNGARAQALFFGEGGALASKRPLGIIAGPSVRDVDGDGRDDLVFGQLGFGILLGQTDRSFVPVLFPSFRFPSAGLVPVVIRSTLGRRVPSGDVAEFVVVGPGNGQLELSVPEGGYAVGLGAGAVVVGTPAYGRVLDGVLASACGEVVLAVDDGVNGSLALVSPCTDNPGGGNQTRYWTERPATKIALPGRPTSSPLLVDHDQDGHLDVVVGVASGTVVLRGRVDGLGLEAPVPARVLDVFDKPLGFEEPPLAAGDLNDDGWPDYVLPRSMLVSIPPSLLGFPGAPEGRYADIVGARPGRRTQAVIGRLNADGLADVASASSETPDIEIITGRAGVVALASATLSTSGPVAELALADTDGDGILDVSIIEKRAGGDTFYSVAYGRPAGPPEPPAVVGRLQGGKHMYPFPVDTAADTLALQSERDGQTEFALLLGSADRQPRAPLLLENGQGRVEDPTDRLSWTVHTPFAGALAQKGKLDLFAAAVGVKRARPPWPVGLWGAQGAGVLDFAVATEFATLDEQKPAYAASDALLLHAAVGDIDAPPDELDDVVVLIETCNATGTARCPAESRAARLNVIRGGGFEPAGIPLPGASLSPSSRVALYDVDGDGARDAVLLLGPDRQTSRLFVHFGDGKAGFAETGIEVAPPADDLGAWTSFAQLAVGGAPSLTPGTRTNALVVSTGTALYAAKLVDRARFEVSELSRERFGDLTGLATGDVDGDGVPDVVVADSGSVRVLLQKARQP